MVVLVAGMRMRVGDLVVSVFVGVGSVVLVLVAHSPLLAVRNRGEVHCALGGDGAEADSGLFPSAYPV